MSQMNQKQSDVLFPLADLSELTAIAGRTKHAIHEAVERELRLMDAEIDKFLKLKLREIQSDPEQSHRVKIKSKLKFGPLYEYFRLNTEQNITMTFDEMGEIIGEPLCDSAYRFREYWMRHGRGRLSDCWYANGYKIKTLDMENNWVSFYKTVVYDDETVTEAYRKAGVEQDRNINANVNEQYASF